VSDWEKRYLGWEHFPVGLDKTEIAVFFALGEGDLAAVQAHRRDTNRLAIAIQIDYMRMTGLALNSVEMIPPAVLTHVAGQLGQTPPRLTSIRALYRRRRTLHDHQEVARSALGLRVLSERGQRKLKSHLRKIVLVQIGHRDLVMEARRWLDHNCCLQLGERVLLARCGANSRLACAEPCHGSSLICPKIAGWQSFAPKRRRALAGWNGCVLAPNRNARKE
jgi:hypothetical protein